MNFAEIRGSLVENRLGIFWSGGAVFAIVKSHTWILEATSSSCSVSFGRRRLSRDLG
jgi:hypothetical protein